MALIFEAKVILSDNPLAEKVTLMHTGDMGGATDKFKYDWRIASPEDGSPPDVSVRTAINSPTSTSTIINTTEWNLKKLFWVIPLIIMISAYYFLLGRGSFVSLAILLVSTGGCGSVLSGVHSRASRWGPLQLLSSPLRF